MRATGLDGLCPSFATRTPDYVRLRRVAGSSPVITLHKIIKESQKVTLLLLVRATGLDGLCPSFATRTPDYVRLRRVAGSSPVITLHKIIKESQKVTLLLLVRATGLEPAHLSAQEPKSCVSASFTTPACMRIKNEEFRIKNFGRLRLDYNDFAKADSK